MKRYFILLILFIFSACSFNTEIKNINSLDFKISGIPIPKNMTIVNKDSFSVKILSNKEKKLTFKGKVDSKSLFDYYMVFMRKNNWHLKSYFKSPKEYLIIFENYPRICVILIKEKFFNTYLNIFELNNIDFLKLKKIPIYEENISK